MRPEVLWLSDSESQSASIKLGRLENCKKPNKGTVGIAGHYPIENSKLAVQMVESGNKKGYKDDQDHPELMVMSLSSDRSYEYLRDQVRILTDYGCDVIVIPESDVDDQQKRSLETETKGRAVIIFQQQLESYEELSVRTLQEVEKSPPMRPNIYDASTYEVILRNIEDDISVREMRISKRIEDDGGYPRLLARLPTNQNVVGVLGGAGPMASAQYSFDVAQQGIPHIHLSNNSAPYKINYALRTGHSFLPHYKNAVKAMRDIVCGIGGRQLSVAAPCNTMHLFLDVLKECPEFKDVNFIDIRDSVRSDITENKRARQILLLGTDATIGIDAAGRRIKGLYDDVFDEIGRTVIKPNREQQDRVNDAIYLSKAGKMKQAQEKIRSVITDIHRQYGRDMDVALVCTDLPIAFGANELSAINAISTVQTLATLTGKMVSKSPELAPQKRNFEALGSPLAQEGDDFRSQLQIVSQPPSKKVKSSEESLDGEDVSEMSDSDEHLDIDINKFLTKYKISYNIDESKKVYRIFFDNKSSDISEIQRSSDMKEFCRKYSKLSNNIIHYNRQYISFRDKGAFLELDKLITQYQIPQKQQEMSNVR